MAKNFFAFCCLVFAFLTLSLFNVNGQTVDSTLSLDNNLSIIGDVNIDLSELLLPLDSIVKIAIQNSPTIRWNDQVVKKAEHLVKAEKNSWLSGIAPVFNWVAGNQTLLLQAGSSTAGAQSSTLSNGYTAGVNVRLPLSEWWVRNARVESSKMEVEINRSKRAEAELALRRQIISEYNDVLTYFRVMKVQNDALQSSKINLAIAEKAFKDGVLDIASYTQIMQITTTNENNFEVAKRQFTIAFYQLETTVGVPLAKLKK